MIYLLRIYCLLLCVTISIGSPAGWIVQQTKRTNPYQVSFATALLLLHSYLLKYMQIVCLHSRYPFNNSAHRAQPQRICNKVMHNILPIELITTLKISLHVHQCR